MVFSPVVEPAPPAAGAVAPPPVVLETRELGIDLAHGAAASDVTWSGRLQLPPGRTVDLTTAPVEILLATSTAVAFETSLPTLAALPDGSFRFEGVTPAGSRLSVRLKARGNGAFDFRIEGRRLPLRLDERVSLTAILSLDQQVATQSLPLHDEGDWVGYQRP